MGFFSSRKAEDNDNYVTTTVATSNDKSVVQVIRSRFYGKKGKEREDLPTSYAPQGATATQILSPNPSNYAASIHTNPRPSTSTRSALGNGILQKSNEDHPLPITPKKKQSIEIVQPPSTPNRTKRGPSVASVKAADTVASPSPRKATDTVTATLAQRLNELAVANSEGLLNDDEYRLLRQSLFDRFAGTSVVPTEESVVPAARPRPKKPNSTPDGRPTSRPLSNFHVEVPRPSSIHSRNSVVSGVTDLIRRATSRRTPSASRDVSDTASIWSATSNSSKIFRLPRTLSKKSSSSSITSMSQAQADTMSISSKRAGGANSEKGSSDHGHPFSPSGSRSAAGSIRRLQTPPSSFPTRAIGQDSRYSSNIRDVFDEDNLKTAQDIQKEITAVEAEARRLMDAFSGLELSTLSKGRRHHHGKPSRSADVGRDESSDTRSQRRYNPTESDAQSIRSVTSAGTSPSVAPSMARSAYSHRKGMRTKNGLNPSLMLSSSSSLHRKNSSSSFTSTPERWRNQTLPPVPALPASISHGHLKAANSSSISLVRSTGHLPMDVVPEDEDKSVNETVNTVRMEDEFENEMDDIRRRREEVSLRYEARLEYLRAKLKGAQLHEKLLRK